MFFVAQRFSAGIVLELCSPLQRATEADRKRATEVNVIEIY
jgi:hypothetical protein